MSSVSPDSSASRCYVAPGVGDGPAPPASYTAVELKQLGLEGDQVIGLLSKYYDAYVAYTAALGENVSGGSSTASSSNPVSSVSSRSRRRRRKKKPSASASVVSDSSVGSAVSINGAYCYVKLASGKGVELGMPGLGGTPTFAAILRSPVEWWDVDKLAKMRVRRVVSGVYHVGQGGVVALELLTALAAGRQWLARSLGARLKDSEIVQACAVRLSDKLAASLTVPGKLDVSHNLENLRAHSDYKIICATVQDYEYCRMAGLSDISMAKDCRKEQFDSVCVYNASGSYLSPSFLDYHRLAFRYVVPTDHQDALVSLIKKFYLADSCLHPSVSYLSLFRDQKKAYQKLGVSPSFRQILEQPALDLSYDYEQYRFSEGVVTLACGPFFLSVAEGMEIVNWLPGSIGATYLSKTKKAVETGLSLSMKVGGGTIDAQDTLITYAKDSQVRYVLSRGSAAILDLRCETPELTMTWYNRILREMQVNPIAGTTLEPRSGSGVIRLLPSPGLGSVVKSWMDVFKFGIRGHKSLGLTLSHSNPLIYTVANPAKR